MCCEFFERLQKHSFKSVSLRNFKTITLLCKEEISIQEKQVDFKNSMGILLKYAFFLRSSFLPPKRKFRESKTGD